MSNPSPNPNIRIDISTQLDEAMESYPFTPVGFTRLTAAQWGPTLAEPMASDKLSAAIGA